MMDQFQEIRRYVAGIIHSDETFEERTARRARELEAEGYRIVDGGQIGRDEDGRDLWEVIDWRTEEVIARGTGGSEMTALYDSNRWADIDGISGEVWAPNVRDPSKGGLPDGLAQALQDWASNDPVEAELWLEATK